MYRFKQVLVGMAALLVVLSLVGCGGQSTPEYGMNEPVTGDEWQITALTAENMGSEFERGGQTIRTDEAGSSLLYVKVMVENIAGEELGVGYIRNVKVRDEGGEQVHWWLAGMAPAVYYDSEAEEGHPIYVIDPAAPSDYIFIVSDDATTFDLLWGDLPAIRLTLE